MGKWTVNSITKWSTKEISTLGLFLSISFMLSVIQFVIPANITYLQILLYGFAYVILSRKSYFALIMIRILMKLPGDIISCFKSINYIEQRLILIRTGGYALTEWGISKVPYDPVPVRYEYNVLRLQSTVDNAILEVSPIIDQAKIAIWLMLPLSIILLYLVLPMALKGWVVKRCGYLIRLCSK